MTSYDDAIYVNDVCMRRCRWEKVLCELMSEISESLWCAGWLIDLEYLLPTLNDKQKARCPVGLYEYASSVAKALGYWVDMEGDPVNVNQ